MLQIAVCGDEASVGAFVKQCPGEYVECEVRAFTSGSELSDSGLNYDILFSGSVAAGECGMTVRVRRQLLQALTQKAEPEKSHGKEPILVRVAGTSYRIDREKILYAENVGRKVALHMKDSQITYYAKMKEVEELLGGQFFRCHRGYLVNFKAVKSYETGSILLKNGEQILMAKQKYNDFVRAYAQYLHGGQGKREG